MKNNLINAEKPIGIFDAGPGGLAVLKYLMKYLPSENVIYLGDTARQPYGPQERSKVEQYTIESCNFLVRNNVKAILIGCNTASIAGLSAAMNAFPKIPILGMIQPGVRAVMRLMNSKKIGVWGTELTVASHAYRDAILEKDAKRIVEEVACSDLLRLAEKGMIQDKEQILDLCNRYLIKFKKINIDTLILGCTDLTCIRSEISTAIGNNIRIIDPSEEIVIEIIRLLSEKKQLNIQKKEKRFYDICITGDDCEKFTSFAESFLEIRPLKVRKIVLDRYIK